MTLPNGQLKSKSGYLPTEVLSNIFQECMESDELDCVTPHPLQAPLVLTWVCRLWRSIALDTHRLWEGVSLIRKSDRISDSTRLLELWIERSGTLPFGVRFANIIEDGEVIISLSGTLEIPPEKAEGIRAFMDTLLQHHKRLRVLEIVVPELSFGEAFVQAATEDAPHLQDLCISFQHLGLNESPSRYDFSRNTEWQRIRLITPRILPLPSPDGKIFENLQELELHFCASVQDCLLWLDMAPNLTQLVVRFFCTGQRPVTPDSTRGIRRLPHLEVLEIAYFAASSDIDNPRLLLDMLDLPELNDLSIDLMHLFDSEEWPHVKNLVLRSGASLLSLCIAGLPMTGAEIVEILRLSPDLAWLDIEIATDSILRALTPRLISEEESTSGSSSHPLPSPEERTAAASDGTDGFSTGPDPADQDGMQVETTDGPSVNDDQTGPTSNLEDLSKYTVMCPKLAFFEASDIDSCSLQVIHEMAVSRCEDVYKDVSGYVDLSIIRPTPEVFKTLNSIVLPCDPVFETLSHPVILESMERNIYF